METAIKNISSLYASSSHVRRCTRRREKIIKLKNKTQRIACVKECFCTFKRTHTKAVFEAWKILHYFPLVLPFNFSLFFATQHTHRTFCAAFSWWWMASKRLQNACFTLTPLRREAEFVMIYDIARKHSGGRFVVKGKPSDINYQSIICGNATCHKSYIDDIEWLEST